MKKLSKEVLEKKIKEKAKELVKEVWDEPMVEVLTLKDDFTLEKYLQKIDKDVQEAFWVITELTVWGLEEPRDFNVLKHTPYVNYIIVELNEGIFIKAEMVHMRGDWIWTQVEQKTKEVYYYE